MRENYATAALFHVTPWVSARLTLLAMILFGRVAQHPLLNRKSKRYARECIDIALSTLADQIGAYAAALKPLHSLIEAHVMTAGRLHSDNKTV